jgi:hypothetical protein
LSPIAADSVGGILWGASSVPRGAQTPQCPDPVPQRPDPRSDTHPFQSRGQGTSIGAVPAHFDDLFFRMSFPVGSGYRTSPESHIFADLSAHASDLLSSFDHKYFDVICLYSSDDP